MPLINQNLIETYTPYLFKPSLLYYQIVCK